MNTEHHMNEAINLLRKHLERHTGAVKNLEAQKRGVEQRILEYKAKCEAMTEAIQILQQNVPQPTEP